jgi:enoyl-[acyl-carrier protein] reductase II
MTVQVSNRLEMLWAKGKAFLGCDYAILGGGMSWVSEHNLVAAISNAGGFGVLACGGMNPAQLADEIHKTQEKTSKPFGVNLITMHPELVQLIDVCKSANVSHVVLAGGLPSAASIRQVKDYGAKAICFAPALVLAKRLLRAGADALVIEGSEAGGHVGPVATSVLVQEILPHVSDIPVFVAGGIGRGEAIASYLEMGAAGCQLGTRFVCAEESIAHPNFKQAFIKANARDAITTVQMDPSLNVIPVRALTNEGTRLFNEKQVELVAKVKAGAVSQADAQLEIEHFWVGALRRAVIDGDVDNGSLMAGQSVGMVKSIQPMAEIMQELVVQANAALENRT